MDERIINYREAALTGTSGAESLGRYLRKNRKKRGRVRMTSEQWLEKNPNAKVILAGWREGKTESAIAAVIGVTRQAISSYLKDRGKDFGWKTEERYQAGQLEKERVEIKTKRAKLVSRLSAENLESLIEEGICPTHFRQIVEACHQTGLSFDLVTNQKTLKCYLQAGGKKSLKQVISSSLVRVNGWLCQVYYSGRSYYTGKGQRTPLWHFAISKRKIRQCHSVILICGNGEIFTVPVKRFRRFHRRKLVGVFIPFSRMVKTPGGRGERLSRSYWLRFAGFPKSWLS